MKKIILFAFATSSCVNTPEKMIEKYLQENIEVLNSLEFINVSSWDSQENICEFKRGILNGLYRFN